MTTVVTVPAEAKAFLTRAGLQLHDHDGRWTPLTGGVSSDLWRVDLPDGSVICVKGALARLRVADEWTAPVSRNAIEYSWLEFAGSVVPQSVPRVFAHDPNVGLFAMEFLDPETHPVWKSQLLDGLVDPTFAESVGDLIGRLHVASRAVPDIPRRFATDENFESLRIAPYFRTTALRNPAIAEVILGVAEHTASTHLALVHGDVSPKNILIGPNVPVILDAECAWWGDPAFDLSFCLTHLALKAVLMPLHAPALRDAARELVDAYFGHIDWEHPGAFSARAAALLPVLALARVDGASPVEYLSTAERNLVRAVSTDMVRTPTPSVLDTVDAWHTQISRRR